MSDRYKYAKNGIYKCENFAQHLEADDFPTFNIGSIGGLRGWYLKYNIEIKDGLAFVSPAVSCDLLLEVQLRTFFNVLKKDGSSGALINQQTWVRCHTDNIFGDPFDVSELLNPENEYLDDEGSLSIEYGIQMNTFFGYYHIWEFNFWDTPFNYTGEENQMIRCVHTWKSYRNLKYYSTEILNFHCPQFVEQSRKLNGELKGIPVFFDCLQILHGVRLQIEFTDYFAILNFAQKFSLSNVIQYCDQSSIGIEHGCYRFHRISFAQAIKFNLRHVLARKLKYTAWKYMAQMIKDQIIEFSDFKEASGEVMKTFVAELLYADN